MSQASSYLHQEFSRRVMELPRRLFVKMPRNFADRFKVGDYLMVMKSKHHGEYMNLGLVINTMNSSNSTIYTLFLSDVQYSIFRNAGVLDGQFSMDYLKKEVVDEDGHFVPDIGGGR